MLPNTENHGKLSLHMVFHQNKQSITECSIVGYLFFVLINLIITIKRGNLNLDISLRNTRIYYLSYKTLRVGFE